MDTLKREIVKAILIFTMLILIMVPIHLSLNKAVILRTPLIYGQNTGVSEALSQKNWTYFAQIAWRYYKPGVGVNPNTGLHYANVDWHRFTDWDLGSYILAILDAEKLGILPTDGEWGADYRLGKILNFLQTRSLTGDDLPYLVYDADNGGLPSEIDPRETNVYDSGRLLIALGHLKEMKPNLSSTIDWIVMNRCNYTKLAENFPIGANPEFYYIAHGFRYFGFNNTRIQAALKSTSTMAEGDHIGIYGISLPNVKLISEPLLHGMFELDPDPIFRDITYRTYLVQEERWRNTGNFTAFTEGAYDVHPYYVYEYIILPPKTWVIYSYGIGEVDIAPVIYFKAVFGFHVLYQTEYTSAMIESLGQQLETDRGFYEGVDETGRIVTVLTDKTNGMIINAARYAMEDRYSDLSEFPAQFINSGVLNNTLIVIPESTPHGPCDPAHTIDTLGGMLITSRLGLEAGSGQLKSAMDGWITNYNSSSGETSLLDTASNLIVVASPGVNIVAYHYNRTKTAGGWGLMDVFFCRNYSSGQNYLHSQTSGRNYYMEFSDGRLTADFATIQIRKDEYGRYVMLVYGLGAEGTRMASEILKSYDQYDLKGKAVIIKYFDSDGDGSLETVDIVEVIH